jgi:N6-adenosine-specific RNA methylase IME4
VSGCAGVNGLRMNKKNLNKHKSTLVLVSKHQDRSAKSDELILRLSNSVFVSL